MSVPKTFRNIPEKVVASYNWTDLAEGTGVVQYYLVRAKETTNATYHIISQALPGFGNPTERNLRAGTYDFNLAAYNTPKVIRGTAVLTGQLHMAWAGTITISIQLKKVDSDDNETTISDVIQSPDAILVSGHPNTAVYLNIPLTTTNFKKGDKLRARIVVADDSGHNEEFGLDPTGAGLSHSGTHPLPPKLMIPYELDL